MDYSKAKYAININDLDVVTRSAEIDANRNFIAISDEEAMQIKTGKATKAEILGRHGMRPLSAKEVAALAGKEEGEEVQVQEEEAPPPTEDLGDGNGSGVRGSDGPPVTPIDPIPDLKDVEIDGGAGTGETTAEDIGKMSINALRAKCRELGIAFTMSNTKAELVEKVKK